MSDEPLLSILRNVVKDAVDGQGKVALAYSGGLDSSVLAALVREVAALSCYTCAVAGSYDAEMVAVHASEQGLATELLLVSSEELIEKVRVVSNILRTTNAVQIAYTIPMVCVIERCSEVTVLGGQGADEVFGGYAKYLGPEDPFGMMSADLDKMRNEAEMLQKAYPSKNLLFPFADERLAIFVEGLPKDRLLSGENRKVTLRDVALALGLQSHSRRKKASQYSSGTLREMRRLAQRDGVTLTEWTKMMARDKRPTP